MAGIPSYGTTVKRASVPTAFTAEAMTSLGSNRFQITDATKRVWDRTATNFRFESGSGSPTTIPSTLISSIDYLFGIVTFTMTLTTPITGYGTYMPLSTIAGAHSYNLNMTADILDDTDFVSANANGGARVNKLGLRDVSLAVPRFDQLDSTFYTLLAARTPLLMEVRPGGAGDVARGWFILDSENHSGDIAALENSDLSFVLDGDVLADFNWGAP